MTGTPTAPTAERLRALVRRVVATQWPILVVVAFLVAAFALVIAGYWRRGALLLGIGVAVASAMRLTLGVERAGLLVVRSRAVDVATTAVVSAAMLYVAWTIDPLGTR